MARYLAVASVLVAWLAWVGPAPAQGQKIEGHSKAVTALVFMPKVKELMSAGLDGKVYVWDLQTGKRAATFDKHKGDVYALACTPDGKTIASAGAEGIVYVWSAETGMEIHTLKSHKGPIVAVAFNHDGTILATGGYDGIVRLWYVGKGEEMQSTKPHKGRITSLAFSGDGKRLAIGGTANAAFQLGGLSIQTGLADQVRVWDIGAGKEPRALDVRGFTAALSPDGKSLFAAGLVPDIQMQGGAMSFDGFDQITRVNVETGGTDYAIKWRGSILAVSPDQKWLATGAGDYLHLKGFGYTAHNGDNFTKMDNRLRLWDASNGKELAMIAEKDGRALAFSPNSQHFAVGLASGGIRVIAVEEVVAKKK